MLIQELSGEVLLRLKAIRWDRFIEKHEGPFSWADELRRIDPDDIIFKMNPDYDPEFDYPEFLQVGKHWVLLPVGKGHHPNIQFLHHFLSEDQKKLVIYLKDTTYYDDNFGSGFVAICDWFDESFFVATFYHEWYIVDYQLPM